MKKLALSISLAAILAACGAAEQSVKGAANTDLGAKVTDAAKQSTAATKHAADKMAEFVTDKIPQKLADTAAGTYSLDKSHAFLTASVSHGGLSDYRMDFTDLDATIQLDPSDTSKTSISFTVNPASIKTHYPGDYKAGHAKTGFESWDEHISKHAKFFNSDNFPKASFQSTTTKRTGPYTAKVTGDLTFLGVSKAVTFDVKYNGVGNKPWFGERDLIGFNADTTISRSEFGLTALKGGIGDEVSLSFSGEFLQNE